MIKAIQTPFYNKIQTAKPALKPYAPSFKSNLERNRATDTFERTNSKPISFKTRYEDEVETKIAHVYSRRISGKSVPVLIERTEQKDVITYAMTRNSSGIFLGEVILCKKEGNIRKIKESYPGETSALLVSSLHAQGKKSHKGIGTTLMQEAVKESYRQGYDGRLFLNAWSGKSPVPFYYKLGLRFVDKEQNAKLEAYMQTPKDKKTKVPREISEGYMYLPEENIDQLLNKKIQK